MLGLSTGRPPAATPEGKIILTHRHGLKVISMGMLIGDDNPAILRGPMVSKNLRMFIDSVQWGELGLVLGWTYTGQTRRHRFDASGPERGLILLSTVPIKSHA
jgi:NUBPL iron-transfer P-loop NTPase